MFKKGWVKALFREEAPATQPGAGKGLRSPDQKKTQHNFTNFGLPRRQNKPLASIKKPHTCLEKKVYL